MRSVVDDKYTDDDAERLARIEALCERYRAKHEELAGFIASFREHVLTARRHARECLDNLGHTDRQQELG